MSLCRSCDNVQTVKSERGSVFLLCKLAKTDARFRKYPPQPVLKCPGHAIRKDIERTDRPQ